MAEMTEQLPDYLVLSEELWNIMLVDVIKHTPEEACGLLGGKGRKVVEVIPVTNVLHSPIRYRMAPEEQLVAFNYLDQLDLDLIGIYHSHPAGPQVPSETDLKEAYYPDAVYIIWHRLGDDWTCRGFILDRDDPAEIPLKIVSDK
jgi:proteasome lid subunit RPN8/RPN11